MLDGVYVDCKDEKAVVGIKPKPAFGPVFQVATTREGSGVTLVKENPPADGPEDAIPAGAATEADSNRCSCGDGGGSIYTVNTRLGCSWQRESKPAQVSPPVSRDQRPREPAARRLSVWRRKTARTRT